MHRCGRTGPGCVERGLFGVLVTLCVTAALPSCQSPPLVAPPPSAPQPTPTPSSMLFVEDFNDQDMSRFRLTDSPPSFLTLTREDDYAPDGGGGFLLERLLTTNSDGSFFHNMTSWAQAPVSGLDATDRARVSALFRIENPQGGDATFGLGLGSERLDLPAYAVWVTVGFEDSQLGLTRNDGLVDLITPFAPTQPTQELELVLAYDRGSGLVEASVELPRGGRLAATQFSDSSPLRPIEVFFYTRVHSSAESVFRIDDIEVRRE